MALFHTDFVALDRANVEAAKRWWVRVFGCKPVRVLSEWDDSLPSDVAPTLPGAEPAPTEDHLTLFCNKIERAHEYLRNRGPAPGPTRKTPARVFEARDPDGHVFEICKEP